MQATSETIRLCKDCRFHKPNQLGAQCTSPNNIIPDLVNGGTKIRFIYCDIARQGVFCGPDARWFEPKQPEQVAA